MRLCILGWVVLFLVPATVLAQPLYRMGEQQFATDCTGRLTDSGGLGEPYGNNEEFTFTICPEQPTDCIRLVVAPFELEARSAFFGGDQLQFFAGPDTDAPLLATFSGQSTDTLTLIASAGCVTVVFTSDGFVTRPGFDLTWTCGTGACGGSSFSQPDLLESIPVSINSSTCTAAATFVATPCGEVDFLNGPERIFAVDSPGGWCVDASLQTDGADLGLLVLTAPPADPAALCLARAANGQARGIDLRRPGRYFFVVAGPAGCGEFTLDLSLSNCPPPRGLKQALCNPLNGCLFPPDSAYALTFSDGYQDIPLVPGQNAGCWLDLGEEPDLRWFTLLTQNAGQLAFELRSGDLPSDIDFNVWGPFDPITACADPEVVIAAVRAQPPIRSSFSGQPLPTGLLPVHPRTGQPVTDAYDCTDDPDSSGDDYVRPLEVQADEVYVVLVNDYGNAIRNGTILLDASYSSPGVLSDSPPLLEASAQLICPGDTVTLRITQGQGNIRWLEDSTTLLDTAGFIVQALPQKTTRYRAEVRSFCQVDTVEQLVELAGLDLPDSLTLCRGQVYQPGVSSNPAARYSWQIQGPLQLSCTECSDPEVVATAPGAGLLIGTQTADNCTFTDTVLLRITTDSVPRFLSRTDTVICAGDALQLNERPQSGRSYAWFLPEGTRFSNEIQPTVQPAADIFYRVEVSDALCGTIDDTVRVTVIPFVTEVSLTVSDNRICAGDTVTLRASVSEENSRQTFFWQGSDGSTSMDSVWQVVPAATTDYTLLYDAGACPPFVLNTQVQVEQPVGLTLTATPNPVDRGAPLMLMAESSGEVPAGSRWIWSENGIEFVETDSSRLETTIPAETSFGVRLRTPFDCVYEAEVLVGIRAFRSEMPNAFSPNGDGVNDQFNLVYRGGEPEIRVFRVYNRWGQLVYDNETPARGWDGTYRGKLQPADVYLYRMQFVTPEGVEQSYEGEVTLIR